MSNINEFINKHALQEHLNFAYSCIHRFFPNPRNLKTVLSTDPCCDESWLSIRFDTEGSFDELERARETYHQLWRENVPAASRFRIRLMYNIVDSKIKRSILQHTKTFFPDGALNIIMVGLATVGKWFINAADYIQRRRAVHNKHIDSTNSASNRGWFFDDGPRY